MLDSSLKDQLRTLFADLQNDYIFDISVSGQHESYNELTGLLDDVASCSDKISTKINTGNAWNSLF